MKNSKLFVALLSVVLVSACESEPSTTLQDNIDQTVQPRALFDPSNSIIPFPNNLLFSGSTDGTLNIPVTNAADLSDPQVALNGVDGFSPVAPMSSEFSTAIDGATVNGTSVKIYEVVLTATGEVSSVIRQLAINSEYFPALSSVDASQSTVAIVPTFPLAPKTSYVVVITDDLLTPGGDPFGPSSTYLLIKNLSSALVFGDQTMPGALQSLTSAELASFEQLRVNIRDAEADVVAFDGTFTTADIIQSWSFTTQSIDDVLTQVRTDVRALTPSASLSLAPTGLEVSPLGLANIYVGTLDVPYYLTAAAGVNDPTPLGSFWQDSGGNDLTYILGRLSPNSTSTQTIPLMVSVPIAGQPATYPIVIYQHGITTTRATMLAVADAFALAGFAVAAIDMPMHGLTGNETDNTQFYTGLGGGTERTFDLDLVTQDATTGDITAAAQDGITDTSGRHYVNLTNLQNTRDNLRQSVSDLFALTAAIGGLTAGANDFDATNINFLGHSLGAIVGATFTTLEPDIKDAVFAFGGGSLPKILDGSAAFSPSIVAGLAAAGVNKGTSDYEAFLGAAQTVVDSGDPVNYATDLGTRSEGILFFEIAGGNTSPSDLVVPITVPDGNDSSNTVPAPLAGTEPMLGLMGLTQVNSDQGPGITDLFHSVKFVVGNHSSLLSAAADPFNSAATNTLVRAEIQTLASTFIGSGGVFVDVTDPSLLEVPVP